MLKKSEEIDLEQVKKALNKQENKETHQQKEEESPLI